MTGPPRRVGPSEPPATPRAAAAPTSSAPAAPGPSAPAELGAGAADERALVAAAASGDRDAQRRLLERYAPPLFSAVILPRVRDRAEAEDVLREVLARAVAALPRFSDRGIGVWPWLRRIAVHALVDRARRRGAAERAMEAYMHEVEVARAGRADDAERAWLDAEEAAVQTRRLGAALALVPERYRRAIELRVLEERPRADVAAAMGVSVATFDVLLHRALAALRKAWSEVAASEEAARGARG